MKQTVFERATRTPMIVAGPGVSAKGQMSHRIVELLDLYPTIAAMAGLTPPAAVEGRSIKPLLVTPNAAWDHPALSQVRRPLSITTARGRRPASPASPASLTGPDADGAQANRGGPATGPNTGYTIRTDLYRYIAWDDGKAGEELFDELNDPGETQNLAGRAFYAHVLSDMRSRLAALRASR